MKNSTPNLRPNNPLLIGTPATRSALRVMLLGSGELGKELIMVLQGLGIETIAVDRYAGAPAMQVAHHAVVINMLDPNELRELILRERPDYIVPEIEAIATSELVKLENEGFRVVPSARAVNLTMNREGIRRLAAEELGLPTTPYAFADSLLEAKDAAARLGYPCVMKPVMSSSGKGQSVIRSAEAIESAWSYAQAGGRSGEGRVIVEAFIRFDYEITQLTVRHAGGVSFPDPIGHIQEDGDYRMSWQPQPMSADALRASREIAEKITAALGGYGVFGVELFVQGDKVFFNEVSPRPHDTGLVTLITQRHSQFALHARALLGIPVPSIERPLAGASKALLVEGHSSDEGIRFLGVDDVLAMANVDLRLFGKPEVQGRRRMGVVLASAESVDEARVRVESAHNKLKAEI
ncbi:MAG: phosphoribosylglycinamide formyltransferase 2 [unclassified Hahellaceae]|nr:phosphoribosylglycinamide formyltransferase 2 [Hahellaceae bacterium]